MLYLFFSLSLFLSPSLSLSLFPYLSAKRQMRLQTGSPRRLSPSDVTTIKVRIDTGIIITLERFRGVVAKSRIGYFRLLATIHSPELFLQDFLHCWLALFAVHTQAINPYTGISCRSTYATFYNFRNALLRMSNILRNKFTEQQCKSNTIRSKEILRMSAIHWRIHD